MSRLGPSFLKIWTCRSSPRSGSRNAWTWIKNVNGASCLSNFWNFFSTIHMISYWAQLLTMDETWLYHYDLETKQQLVDWGHSGSPRPKKFWVQKSTGKFFASIFWDQDSILLIDYLPKDQTINAEYWLSLLLQLKDILKEKCCRKVTKVVLFLHDSALAHWALVTHKKLAYLGFQCLDHPSYSQDLALLDYHLFLGLKKQLKGCHFSSNVEVCTRMRANLICVSVMGVTLNSYS